RIETAPLRLRSLAERLQSMFFLQAEDKGVLFETRCDADDLVSAMSTGAASVLLIGIFRHADEFNRVGVLKKFHFCRPWNSCT
ncbi:hypothetical protein NE553_15625, partial [Eggerthella lenta]|nr:hypothetical protein [Eggerthella lenta]